MEPQARINPETGQKEIANVSWSPVDENQLQAEAEAARLEFEAASSEVLQAEEVLRTAQVSFETAQADSTAKAQRLADAEAAHVSKSAVVDAVANALPPASEQSQPDTTAEPVDVSDRIQVAA